ncbi:unnamed protein product, partial [Symbiodinium sp. KB8]
MLGVSCAGDCPAASHKWKKHNEQECSCLPAMASIRRRHALKYACSALLIMKLSRHYGDVGFVTSAPHVAKHRVFEVGSRRGCRLRAAALGLGTDTSSGDLALGAVLLAFLGTYLPQVLRLGQGSTWQVDGFRYFANRGRQAFSDATHALAGKYPGYRDNAVFTYFDTFGGKTLPDMGSYSRLLQLIDRGVSDVYDHKRGLELRLREYGCSDVFAATYFSSAEALQATSSEPDALFFAKLPEQSGGRGIRILRREDLQREELPSEYIIQRAVQDLELIDDRKFVIRYFFVVHRKCIYLHEVGVLIVHGEKYDRRSVDMVVQAKHDWYDDRSETYLITLQSAEQAPRWRKAIAAKLREALPALGPLLDSSGSDRYTLVGGDALIQSNGEAKLIEFNMYPNLFSDQEFVDKQVYTTLLKDMMELLLLGKRTSGFVWSSGDACGAEKMRLKRVDNLFRHGSAKGRRRDVLPLPLLLEWPADVDLMGSKAADALHFAKFCIVSLNVLWSDFKTSRLCRTAPGKPTAPQLEAQKHIAAKTARMLSRFNSASGASWEWQGSFQKFEQAGSARSEPLVGSAVDLPNRAGTCDPLLHVGADLQAAITDAASIFPDAPTHAIGPVSSSTDNYGEYVKLVAREIACGKMRLRRSVRGVAPVFAVGKSAAGHQRKIWNGAELSEVAARPPAPPRLANPSSFLDLDLEPQEAVWFSKRDAETFFDVLKVPEELTPWFGQPAVRVKDLLEAGAFDIDFVNSLVDDLDATPLQVSEDIFPVSTVWPMGFSWSSVVAQSTTLACVTRAGVPLECALSVECPPPSHQAELCMVATDDVVFMHRDKARASETLQKFDSCLEEAGIPRKAVKDVTCADEITALGCDIHSRPHVAEPSKPKLVTCVSALLDVLGQKRASPRAVNGLLGLLQWLCLLQRPVFGVFNKVYDFVRQQPDTHKAELPVAVLRELAVALGLMPLLSVSLDRQYL